MYAYMHAPFSHTVLYSGAIFVLGKEGNNAAIERETDRQMRQSEQWKLDCCTTAAAAAALGPPPV